MVNLYPWMIEMPNGTVKTGVVYAEDNIQAGEKILLHYCPPEDIRELRKKVCVGVPIVGDFLEITADNCIPAYISPLITLGTNPLGIDSVLPEGCPNLGGNVIN